MLVAVDSIAMTSTGLQRRDNEDASFARPPVFVVADGMGGAQAGEVASRIAVEAFEQGLPDSGNPEERLAARAQEANHRIYELSRAEHERAGMGTTLTAAYLDDSNLAIAHVGDSRAYLFRDGALQRLTQDHSLVDELVRRGKLTEAQAAEHPQRSIITRALGPEPTVDVDTWTYPVRAGDVLLLCSDGLTSMISEERVAEILGSPADVEQAAAQLIDEANEAGGRDNITVVLSRIEEVGPGPGATNVEETMVAVPPSQLPVHDGPSAAARAAPPTSRATATTTAKTATAKTATAAAPTTRHASPSARVPLARTQGRPVQRPPRRRVRYAKPLAALVATLIVLGLVLGGGYLATRQLYFIGTNSQGIVTIYRGLPYDLPAGVHLYETFYVSGVPAMLIPPDRRGTLLNHQLRSETDASNLVRELELGQLSQ
jgi:PPM family protein phosphatase